MIKASNSKKFVVVLIAVNIVFFLIAGLLFLTLKNGETPSSNSPPINNKAVSLAQEYQQASSQYRDEKGALTKEIPLIVFDLRSKEAYLEKHIKKASQITVTNLKALADSGFLKGKTIMIVTDNEASAKEAMINSHAKEITILSPESLDNLPEDLIDQKVNPS